MSVIISFVTPEAVSYLPFVIFGTYGGWLYLRYLLRNTETNLNGDPKDEFAFSTFFPGFIRYFFSTFLLCLIYAVNKGLFFFSFLFYVEAKCSMTLKWTYNKNKKHLCFILHLDHRKRKTKMGDSYLIQNCMIFLPFRPCMSIDDH